MIQKFIMLLFICLSLFAREYKFKQIGEIPAITDVALGYPILIYDTNHNGLYELLLVNNKGPFAGKTFAFDIWEYTPGGNYELVYREEKMENDTIKFPFELYAVGDIDNDGLADIIGRYSYEKPEWVIKTVMKESPDVHSYPIEVVWEKQYGYDYIHDQEGMWFQKTIIADIDRDGKNECIMYLNRDYEEIYVAKCLGDNKLEIVDSSQCVSRYGGYSQYMLIDLDGDRKYEIFFIGSGGEHDVYENTKGYKFEMISYEDISLPNAQYVFSSEDTDRDGKAELFIGYRAYTSFSIERAWLYRWEAVGDNKYKKMLVDSVDFEGIWPDCMSTCGDIDSDGINEIIWTTGTNVYIYKSYADDKYEKVWEWKVPKYDPWGGPRVCIRVFDINSNGYPEMFLSHHSDSEQQISIFEIDTTSLGVVSKKEASTLFLRVTPSLARDIVTIECNAFPNMPFDIYIYDASGRLIKSFRALKTPSGYTKILWNRTNEKGLRVSAGIYFICFKTKQFEATKKLVIVE